MLKKKEVYQFSRIEPLSLALTLGTIWGVSVFLIGLLSKLLNLWHGFVNALSTAYFGYATTFSGSLVGGIWAFIDAFIGGLVIAWVYNWILKKRRK